MERPIAKPGAQNRQEQTICDNSHQQEGGLPLSLPMTPHRAMLALLDIVYTDGGFGAQFRTELGEVLRKNAQSISSDPAQWKDIIRLGALTQILSRTQSHLPLRAASGGDLREWMGQLVSHSGGELSGFASDPSLEIMARHISPCADSPQFLDACALHLTRIVHEELSRTPHDPIAALGSALTACCLFRLAKEYLETETYRQLLYQVNRFVKDHNLPRPLLAFTMAEYGFALCGNTAAHPSVALAHLVIGLGGENLLDSPRSSSPANYYLFEALQIVEELGAMHSATALRATLGVALTLISEGLSDPSTWEDLLLRTKQSREIWSSLARVEEGLAAAHINAMNQLLASVSAETTDSGISIRFSDSEEVPAEVTEALNRQIQQGKVSIESCDQVALLSDLTQLLARSPGFWPSYYVDRVLGSLLSNVPQDKESVHRLAELTDQLKTSLLNAGLTGTMRHRGILTYQNSLAEVIGDGDLQMALLQERVGLLDLTYLGNTRKLYKADVLASALIELGSIDLRHHAVLASSLLENLEGIPPSERDAAVLALCLYCTRIRDRAGFDAWVEYLANISESGEISERGQISCWTLRVTFGIESTESDLALLEDELHGISGCIDCLAEDHPVRSDLVEARNFLQSNIHLRKGDHLAAKRWLDGYLENNPEVQRGNPEDLAILRAEITLAQGDPTEAISSLLEHAAAINPARPKSYGDARIMDLLARAHELLQDTAKAGAYRLSCAEINNYIDGLPQVRPSNSVTQ